MVGPDLGAKTDQWDPNSVDDDDDDDDVIRCFRNTYISELGRMVL
jgi:hypothetical protein